MDEQLSVNGTRLQVRIERSEPANPWLIFSNSLMTNLSVFDAQADALKSRFNIIRYDQRGHGGSPVTDGIDFSVLGQDIISILDQAQVDNAAFIGLSMGVPTGLSAYSIEPRRFSAMVFMDGQAASAPGGAEQWQQRIDTATRQGMTDFSQTTTDRWLADPNQDGLDRLQAMIAATPLAGFVAGAGALKSFDFSAVVPTLTIPVLTMAGADDGGLPAKLKAIAEAVPQGQFVEIAGAGHLPCFEQPDAVNRALLQFLNNPSH